MATTIVRRPLSGSDMGQPIGVSSTGGATNTVLHNTTSATTILDEIYLYAQNNYSQTAEVIIEFGLSATNATIIAAIGPRSGPEPIITGFPLFGSAGCQTIRAYVGYANGGSASVINTSTVPQVSVFGWVNRITQT